MSANDDGGMNAGEGPMESVMMSLGHPLFLDDGVSGGT